MTERTAYARTAEIYRAAGWGDPLPLPPAAKKAPPTGYTGREGIPITEADIREWIDTGIYRTVNKDGAVSDWPVDNIALRAPVGIAGVDVDQYDEKHGADALAELCEHLGVEMPPTWVSSSRPAPSGIRWYRIPEGVELRSAPLPGVEIIQRHHRYAVAPPSIHPTTRQPYQWRRPDGTREMKRPPSTDELPELPAALVEEWRSDAQAYEATTYRAPGHYEGPVTRTAAVQRVLDSIGPWGQGSRHDQATAIVMALARLENLTHPGATEAIEEVGRSFQSAVGGERGTDREWRDIVTSARQKAASTASTTDDYRDLAKPSLSNGITPPMAPPSTNGASAPANVDAETGEVLEDDDPMPLPDPTRGLPPFPLEALPEWMATEATAAAAAVQVPIEMTAGLAILALSIAVAGKAEVAAGHWQQTLNLYSAILATTGTGKSPAAERMLAPIKELEDALAADAADEVAMSESRAISLASQVAQAKKQLEGDPGNTAKEVEYADIRRTEAEHRELQLPRLTIDDHTPEALAITLAGQPTTRIAVVSPEGATLFETMTGKRYRSSDAAPHVPEIYLKGWGGESLNVDRVGRPTLKIRKPVLTVCVMVQPEVIAGLASTPMIARQGGLARFLWIVARDIVGTRDRRRHRTAPPPSQDYRRRLLDLGRRHAAMAEPVVYRATEDAADWGDDLAVDRERRLGFGGDLEAHRAIEAKMSGYLWRLAGLLAVANEETEVTAERVRQASKLFDFFMAHGIAAHAIAGASESASGTWRQLAAWCQDHPGETLDVRDVWLKMRSTYPKIADMRSDIEQLVALRWLVHTDGEMDAIGVQSRPNPTLTVHPRVSRV